MSDSSQKSLGHAVVTGGCGFLGHHIVKLLAQRFPDTRISVLDLRTTNNRLDSPNVQYHDGDITDPEAVQALFAKLRPDVVIHTASPNAMIKNQSLMYKVNVDGTKNLLAAARDNGAKGFVYTSSASIIMDNVGELVNADETYPIIAGSGQPSYYTSTKGWAEIAVLEANRPPTNPQFLTCAIRPAGIFGEGDVQLMPPMLGAYFRGQHRFQLGDNTNLFDFTYVGNVAHAHLLAAAALLKTHTLHPTIPLDTERVDGEAFFVTNNQPVPFWDFPRALWREAGNTMPLSKVWTLPKDVMMPIGAVLEWVCWAIGRKPNITRDQVRFSCVRRYYDISKAKKRLGYRPIVSLDEGIKRGVREVLNREGAEWAWMRGGKPADVKTEKSA